MNIYLIQCEEIYGKQVYVLFMSEFNKIETDNLQILFIFLYLHDV